MKKKLLKTMVSAAFAVMLTLNAGAAFAREVVTVNVHNTAENGLYITMDGNRLEFGEARPYIDKNGRTQVPVREFCEQLGCTVEEGADGQATVVKNSKTVTFKAGESTVRTNGLAREMDTAAVISDGRIYVPMRYAAEELGYPVEYTTSDEEPESSREIYVVGEDEIPPEILDELASRMPEDEFEEIFGGGLVKEVYGEEDIPEDYARLLSGIITEGKLYMATAEDVNSQSKDYLDKRAVDLSKGAAGFELPAAAEDAAVYNSAALANHGGDLLIKYVPAAGTVSDGEIWISLYAYNEDVPTPYRVASFSSGCGQSTAALLKGLRDDRIYTIRVGAENIAPAAGAVIIVAAV